MRRPTALLAALLLSCLAPAGCSGDDSTTASSPTPTFAGADGTPVDPVVGLPTVKLAADGAPSITIPSGMAKPLALVIQPLKAGDGAVVASGQTVTIRYTCRLWDGTMFDSSWEKGTPLSVPIGTGQLIPGLEQGLTGQKVGSQVLLLIPPTAGYEAQTVGKVPANSSLAFVVDILGVE